MTLYEAVRPLLFALPAETVHDAVKAVVMKPLQRSRVARELVRSRYRVHHPALETEVFGLSYPNPIGLTAGFDKNCEVLPFLADLGFGFVHGGTVTPYGQPGNPRPRMYRLREDRGLVNYVGLPNEGAEAVARRLERQDRPTVPTAIHVDKMNEATHEEAVDHYARVVEKLSPYADYFVVGSCPNTPEDFDKTETEYLEAVFERVQAVNEDDKPILARVRAEDPERQRAIAATIEDSGLDGVVSAAPEVDRDSLRSRHRYEPGNVTGRPATTAATEMVRRLYDEVDIPIIGVGGVDSPEAAYRHIRAGASLVMLYTEFVYRGPSTANQLASGLLDLLEADGFDAVTDAVGVDA